MSQEEKDEWFETRDIGIAASLFVSGIPLASIRREAPTGRYSQGRAVFCFEQADVARERVQEYFRGSLRVDPQALLGKVAEYRRLIFNKEEL